ncbi:TadE-like protein [Actinomadura rubteroloni]|uniref:TadE-like protein n=1 Tax=Actinomadura rubteroloni TaxID=1926885 RepID=A0A2P4UQC2_9ACTN|nr:Tad domain-containing protein [Actinomadura rubteroloni]POM27257.1 TadE-like protein [Actinomadura rubteroloni]
MHRDDGTISLYVVLFAPSVLLLAGLLVDGGLAIHARQRAADIAEQAARAGANQIDDAALRRTGKPVLDPARARAAACAMVTDYDATVTGRECDADTRQVRVTVRLTVRSQILGIVPGLGSFTMTSAATAEPVTGNDAP